MAAGRTRWGAAARGEGPVTAPEDAGGCCARALLSPLSACLRKAQRQPRLLDRGRAVGKAQYHPPGRCMHGVLLCALTALHAMSAPQRKSRFAGAHWAKPSTTPRVVRFSILSPRSRRSPTYWPHACPAGLQVDQRRAAFAPDADGADAPGAAAAARSCFDQGGVGVQLFVADRSHGERVGSGHQVAMAAVSCSLSSGSVIAKSSRA